jgi:hypothetical protein
MFDTIAPVTQDTERQDEDEGNTDTHPDLNEAYDLSEDLGIGVRAHCFWGGWTEFARMT